MVFIKRKENSVNIRLLEYPSNIGGVTQCAHIEREKRGEERSEKRDQREEEMVVGRCRR